LATRRGRCRCIGALDSSERVLGAEHPQTLTSVNNLAECLRKVGHPELPSSRG
jgi:hypothetical protein